MSNPFALTDSPKSTRERVIRHLLAEFERLNLEAGTRLPPSRTLAKSLGVSLTTVQAAIRDLAANGKVRTEVGNGSFLISGASQERTEYRVALGLPPVNPEDRLRWSGRIGEAILRGASSAKKHLTFFSLDCAADAPPEAVRALVSEKRAHADALILLPHPHARMICEGFEAASKPVVHYNAPNPEATTQFISPDYYHSSLRLAEAWRKAGRRNIVLVTFGRLKDSVSALQRSLGLLAGIGSELNRTILYRVEETQETGIEDGYRAAKRLFSAKAPPDAVCCIGDLLGIGVLEYLNEHGIACPEQVSVVGGSGNLGESDGKRLTVIRQPFEAIGEAIVEMLLRCLESGGQSQPASYIPCTLRTGSSTTLEENRLLTL